MVECRTNYIKQLTKRFLKFTIYIISIVIFSSVLTPPITVQASELGDIEQQITDNKALQAQKQKDFNSAQQLLNSLKNQSFSVSSNIGDLKKQIQDLQNKTDQVNSQIVQLEKNIQDTQNLLDTEKSFRDNQIKQYFMDSYVSDQTSGLSFIQSNTLDDLQTSHAVKSYAIKVKNGKLDDILQQYNDLTSQRQLVQDLKKQLSDQNAQLIAKQQSLQLQLSTLNSNIGSKVLVARNLQGELVNLNSNIISLNESHKKILEAELANQTQHVDIKSGQYYFLGRGRDFIDGHGMGFSQWGAYGMEQKGFNFSQMIKFYYPGVEITSSYPVNQQISIIYCSSHPQDELSSDWSKCSNYPDPVKIERISFDNYVSGIGEVPSYFGDEATKAQVILARTYALRVTNNGDPLSPICISDQCQVYIYGSQNKKSFNLTTKNTVVTYNGSPIVSYFTASIRGCSSRISTVWGGADLPYIQSVNDDAYAYKDYTTSDPYNPGRTIKPYNWIWNTNGYDLKKLSYILQQNSSTNVGNIESIDTQKDRCGRTAVVTIKGDKGTKALTGWDFRRIFNNNMDILHIYDYVYSTEFSFEQK